MLQVPLSPRQHFLPLRPECPITCPGRDLLCITEVLLLWDSPFVALWLCRLIRKGRGGYLLQLSLQRNSKRVAQNDLSCRFAKTQAEIPTHESFLLKLLAWINPDLLEAVAVVSWILAWESPSASFQSCLDLQSLTVQSCWCLQGEVCKNLRYMHVIDVQVRMRKKDRETCTGK